jgi:competence protein ComGC
MRQLGEEGFTLQELLAVAGLLILLVVPSLFLTHPKNYAPQQRDAQRRVIVAEVMQAMHAYIAHTGSLPSDIPAKMEPIGPAKNQVNLCSDLVPTYLSALPVDPIFGKSVPCTPHEQYVTGLAIQKTGKGNQLVIASLASEGKIIYLTD